MKVMLMAGGTGGHIFPAAAVGEQLLKRGHEVRWLGSNYGMEGSLVPKLGFEFCGLPVTAWHGGLLRKVQAPLNLVRAVWASFWIFKTEKPDVVVGFGGYPSAPGGLMAWLRRLPLVLHEQNGVPGMTNKRLAPKATEVLQAFPNTFSQDFEVVGNPVREALCHLEKPSNRGLGSRTRLRILVLGGSQGAEAVNRVVPKALALLDQSKYEVWHQAGSGKAEVTQGAYASLNVEATVVEFIDEMKEAYEWADMVIGRSGASTVSEIAAVGLFSILVPYPWHKDQQQYRNAQWLVSEGAAEIIEQQKFNEESLSKSLKDIERNRSVLVQRSDAAWHMGIRDSAKRIVNIVEGLDLQKERP